MKKSLTFPSLASMYFNSLRGETAETIYTYNDEYMRHFMRQSIRRVKCVALNQYCKSIISHEVFNIISEELNVNDSLREIS